MSAGALLAGSGSTSMASPDPPPAATVAGPTRVVAAPQRPRSGHVTVSIDNYGYRPRRLTVTSGTAITFVNHDQQPHTATFEPASLGDKAIVSGASATITLSRPGTYHYFCQFHAFMRATVVVRPRRR